MVQETETKRDVEEQSYHRKMGKRGGTRSLAVGAILPLDWQYVKVKVLKLKGTVCVLQITKLD